MFKRFIPFATAKNIYEIPMEFYKKLGIEVLMMDLDNTLDSYKLFKPTEKAVMLISDLRENGITPIVVSNNKGKRVKSYADALNIEYVNSARKPFSFKLNKVIKIKNLNREKLLFIGDQMMTDVLACRGAHVRMILTEKLVKEDQWTTHINRLFGNRIRHYLKKRNKLKEWREIYGSCN
ncbi:MAG: YqeG family HAD IIIA-type phosphatase [Erysipelotrichaceae bacterium]|nr:YqeG family HAD IIIA-type phosphatase [Erysipelotrichaceae bacterium]